MISVPLLLSGVTHAGEDESANKDKCAVGCELSVLEELEQIFADYPDDFTQSKDPSTNFWVDDSGSDIKGCGLLSSNPCKTVSYVERFRAQDGSTIHIGEGTYYWDPTKAFGFQPNMIRAPYNNMTYIGEGPGDTVFEGIAQDSTTMPEQELWELEIGPAHNLEEYGVNLVNWNEGVAIVLESIVYTADSSATASEIAAGLAFRWNLNLEMSALATATVQGDTVSFTGDPSLSFSITEDENADNMELDIVDDVNVTYGWARVEVSGTTIQDLTIQNMYRKGISATGSDKTGLVIDNVEVTDTFGPGIYVQGAHEHNWSGVEIMNSTIDNTCNGAEELDELAVAGECLRA